MTTAPLQRTRWQLLTSEQRRSVLALQIAPERIEFAGTMAQALAVGEGASPDCVAGLAVFQAEAPVGFVVLCRCSRQSEWAPTGAVALRAIRIDSREQGRGHGKRALDLAELAKVARGLVGGAGAHGVARVVTAERMFT